jgi:diguanylate cyclase (GGDEF)-like protein
MSDAAAAAPSKQRRGFGVLTRTGRRLRPQIGRVAHESREAGLLAFALASVVGFAAAIAPGNFARPQMTAAAVILAGVTVGLAVGLVRRPLLPLVAASILLFYTALTLILLGDGGGNEGLLALVAIPVVACALYGPPWLTILSLLAATSTLVMEANANALSVSDYAQLLTVWPITGIGIAYTIHQLRFRLERTVAAREDAIHHDAILSLIADELYSTFDGERVLSLGLQSAARLTDITGKPGSDAVFFLVDGERATLIASYSAESAGEARDDPRIDRLSVPLSSTTNLLAAVAGGGSDRLFVLNSRTPVPPEIRALLEELEVVNAIVQLVRVGDSGTGLMAVVNKGTAEYTSEQREQLRGLAPIVEFALSRALVFEAQATTDHLTGLANRREFDRRLSHMPRSTRYSVLAIDVDRLQTMNDAFGHRAGDELLQAVAAVLRQSTRRGDVVARVSGDEFLVVLPDADDARATIIVDRILAGLAATAVQGWRPSISVGVAAFAAGTDPAARVAAADTALYQAKRAGGDQVVHAEVKSVTAPVPIKV